MSETAGLAVTQHEYKHVFGIYVPIAIGVFATVLLVTLVAVVVFRRRDPAEASRRHENNLAEGAYAVALVCVIAFLLYVTFSAEHQTDTVAARERPSVVIDVYGAKWEWHFHYPAFAIDRYSGTVGRETLVVPTGEAIRLRLISQDVIHEFWVPELRWKHDLIPGSVQEATVTFSRAGTFPGQCAEFCGIYHSEMIFRVQALSPAQFLGWAASHGRAPLPASGGAS